MHIKYRYIHVCLHICVYKYNISINYQEKYVSAQRLLLRQVLYATAKGKTL